MAGLGSILVHCISGWDRTPLFISLLRLTLWAVSGGRGGEGRGVGRRRDIRHMVVTAAGQNSIVYMDIGNLEVHKNYAWLRYVCGLLFSTDHGLNPFEEGGCHRCVILWENLFY